MKTVDEMLQMQRENPDILKLDMTALEERIAAMTVHFAAILEEGLDIDLDDPNFKETPRRIAKSWVEMLFGCYCLPIESYFEKAFPSDYEGIVAEGPFQIISMCPHHFLPVVYQCFIGYIPQKGKKFLGVSKIARLAEDLAKRPVLQEQLTQDISNQLARLEPQGSLVMIKGIHNCMLCRGIKKPAPVTTSVITGCFEKEGPSREEIFDLMKISWNDSRSNI